MGKNWIICVQLFMQFFPFISMNNWEYTVCEYLQVASSKCVVAKTLMSDIYG